MHLAIYSSSAAPFRFGRPDKPLSSAPGEFVVLFCTHLNNAASTFLEDWARYLEWPPCTVDLRIVLARNSACTFYKLLKTVFSLGWARAPLSSHLGETINECSE